jgi:SAM-dependent methyltransferase
MERPPSWSERLFALYYPCLAARAEDAGLREIRRRLISYASGDTLEVGAGTGLSTWVLCSVDDPLLALSEIARVLRPGGQFLFLEHVRAPDGSRLGRLQDLVQRPHRALAGGCHPNRRTAALIEQSPLALQWLTRDQQPSLLLTVRPIILGSARRPAAPDA